MKISGLFVLFAFFSVMIINVTLLNINKSPCNYIANILLFKKCHLGLVSFVFLGVMMSRSLRHNRYLDKL